MQLFVGGPDAPPRIASYSGYGFLSNWLRVVATRTFLELTKRKDRARERIASEERLLALAMPDDLALDLVKAELRGAVTTALRAAVTTLEPGDRHLLRQHLVAGFWNRPARRGARRSSRHRGAARRARARPWFARPGACSPRRCHCPTTSSDSCSSSW